LVCVDLDTLEWPGARKRVHDEDEHAYRHPRRSGTPAHQDAFSLLVIFVSTMLLRDAPSLLDHIHPQVDVPNAPILFSQWDLRDGRDAIAFDTARQHANTRG